jgi:hypothetical protein
MRDFAIVFVHLIVTLARLARPGGLRSVVAESVLVRHQLLILNRGRMRAPNLRATDRIIAGLCALFMRPARVLRSAIVLKPSSLLHLHSALRNRKYRMLFLPRPSGAFRPNAPPVMLCSVLDGYSRFLLHWELRASMTEADIEIILQATKEKYPEARPRIITDAVPRDANLLEGHIATIRGPVAPTSRQQTIRPGLRLRGQLCSDAGKDVRASAEGVKRNFICKYGLVWQSKVQTRQRYLQRPWSACVVAAPIVGQYIVRLE